MDDGFEVALDRQWRPAVIAVSLSDLPKGSYQRYNQMSEEIIQKMVEDLSEITAHPIALSFNAGSWVRSRRFHIKAHVTVDVFCELLKSRGQDAPNDQQKKSLVARSYQLDVLKAAAEFSAEKATSRVFKINGFTCRRLSDSVECKFSYLKLSPVENPKEIKKAVETFEGWFAKQCARPSYGFAVYLLPAKQSEGWEVFVRIDGPSEYSRLFPKAKATFGAYRPPKRKYRE